ncbi:MAG: cobalamin B12-binding domain-containing protein [Planctomycetota bacterium]
MNPADRHAAETIDSVSKTLSEWTLAALAEEDPTFERRHDAAALRLWRGEMRSRVGHLAEAVAAACPELFARNVGWSREAFEARGLPLEDLRRSVTTLGRVIDEKLPPTVASRAAVAIEAAHARLDEARPGRSDRGLTDRPEPLAGEDPDATAARLYLLHMLERQEEAASDLVLELQERGRGTVEIYERILAPALAEIGRMWHLREASIADEHFTSGATRMIMAELRRNAPRATSNGRAVLCTAVGGDLHDLGIRMVADAFEFSGWSAECLGADMPPEEVVDALESRVESRFDLLAVAANTTLGIRPTGDLVDAVRSSRAGSEIRILVGGLPFRMAPELVETVGADAGANSASDAVRVAEGLFEAAGSSRFRQHRGA